MRVRTHGSDLPTPDGGQAAVENDDGSLVGYAATLEDAARYIEDHNDHAKHHNFFHGKRHAEVENAVLDTHGGINAIATAERLASDSPQEARQAMRRMAIFEMMLGKALAARVNPGPSPNIMKVSFEEYRIMHSEYEDCSRKEQAMRAAGLEPDYPAKRFPFQPLAAYAHQINRVKLDGSVKVIRPIMQNEVGFYTNRDGVGRIVVLKDQGPGDVGDKYFQVPGGEDGNE